ncbi:MAG: chromosomal replication initiator protein DnaA [Solirubrobacterales bacterium]
MRPDRPSDDLASLWGRVTSRLRDELPASTFSLWIAPLRAVSFEGSTLRLAAPQATRAWVERRYAQAVEVALRKEDCDLSQVAIVPAATEQTPPGGEGWTSGVESLPIDQRHTFERFVIGDGNRLAHAAALAVAESPGEAYNPLFLHGAPGLGKTHLLGAIGNYLRQRRAELQVHYTTAERFTSEFVTALRKDGPERFKRRYRGLDALLIDDVQALEGKEHTQEEFVHTFNALHATGKQIVLSSDRPPEALARLAERLRDRFQWGLCAAMGAPDLRTRTTLLWRMAADAPGEAPEPLALRELAGHAIGNVRRLEGAMTRVIAMSSVLGTPVTRDLVHRALGSGEGRAEPQTPLDAGSPSVSAIQEAACSVLGVARSDVLSSNRTARVARARQLAIYLTRELTTLSLAQIAREFDRDHSTVLHAIRAVAGRLEPGSETIGQLDQARTLVHPAKDGAPAVDPTSHQNTLAPQPPPTHTPPATSGTA